MLKCGYPQIKHNLIFFYDSDFKISSPGDQELLRLQTGKDSVEVSVNKLVNKFFWAVRHEYSEDKSENALTEAEKHWLLKKDDLGEEYGISNAYYSRSLKDFDRHLGLNDYVRVKNWIKSYMQEEDKPQVDVLVDSLLEAK